MNIAFVKKLYSPVGGSEALTYQLSTQLAARGHRVRVICLWPPRRQRSFPPATDLLWQENGVRAYLHRGVEIIQLQPYLGRAGRYLDVLAPFRLLRKPLALQCLQGFDLVHNVCRAYASQTLSMARQLQIPYVATPLTHPGQLWGGASRHDLKIYRQADAVVALTRYERRWYAAHKVAADRLQGSGLGPNGDGSGDGARFRHRHQLIGPLVLYVGRKEAYKGVYQLLAACRLVSHQRPGLTLALLGQPSLAYRLELRRHRSSSLRVLDLSSVSQQDKADALAACDLLSLPSRYETFGMVLAEAWLYGKPVVVSDTPTLSEVVGNGEAGLVTSPSPVALAETILTLLNNHELASRLGAAGKTKVEEMYNWQAVTDRHEQLYLSLLRGEVGCG